MTKKFISARIGLAVIVGGLLGSQVILADESIPVAQEISLYINEELVDTSLSNPVRVDGRVLVPAREVFETLGAEVEYKPTEKKVYILYDEKLMILELNNTEVWLDGEQRVLDVPAQIINDKLMIPVRFVSEEFGFEVKWNETLSSVSINKPRETSSLTDEDIAELFPGLDLGGDSEEELSDSKDNVDFEVEGPKEDSNNLEDKSPSLESDESDSKTTEEIEENVETDSEKNDNLSEDSILEENLEEEVPQVILEFKNLAYSKVQEKQIIEVKNMKKIGIENIEVNDRYMDRTIEIVLDDVYKDVLESGQVIVNDEFINSITVQHLEKTVITINEKVIRSVSIEETEDGLRIILQKPSDQYEKIVFIDTGHGDTDSGAVGIGGVLEKDVNFSLFSATMDHIDEYCKDIKVYVSRGSDVFYSLQERALAANEIGADAFVSLHTNSMDTPVPYGAEVLYTTSTVVGDPTEQMAQMMQDKLVNELGLRNRGIKKRPDLYVLRKTNMPAVLIEFGFITNPDDLSKLTNPEFVDKTGQQVAIFISEIFEMDYFSTEA